MKLLLGWLILLTDSFSLLMIRQRQIEAKLKQLEEEVRALREQRPAS
jgi:hypothetical protein